MVERRPYPRALSRGGAILAYMVSVATLPDPKIGDKSRGSRTESVSSHLCRLAQEGPTHPPTKRLSKRFL